MEKSERLNIRLTPEEHAVLRRAADLTGQTVSEYVRRRVLADAHDDLVDRGRFSLDDAAWAAFTQRLKRPGRYNDRLGRLIEQAPPWDDDEEPSAVVVDLMQALERSIDAPRSKESAAALAKEVAASLAQAGWAAEWRVIFAPKSANVVIVGDDADIA